jgi:hypothetical protein
MNPNEEFLKKQYEITTGDMRPNNQVFWPEWYDNYIKWVESELYKRWTQK